jgi:hypothetical protein
MKNYIKVKVSLYLKLLRRKGVWGNWCIDPLVGGEWSASRPCRFTPGERGPVPIGQEAGWAPETVWMTWRRKNSWPYRDSNCNPSVVHPVASRYTDFIQYYLSLVIFEDAVSSTDSLKYGLIANDGTRRMWNRPAQAGFKALVQHFPNGTEGDP